MTVKQSTVVDILTQAEWEYVSDRAEPENHYDVDITIEDCRTALQTLCDHPSAFDPDLFCGFTTPPPKCPGTWREAIKFLTSAGFAPHELLDQHIYCQWQLSAPRAFQVVEAVSVRCNLL